MIRTLPIRCSCAVALCAALFPSPATAAAQTSFGIETLMSAEQEESLSMVSLHFHSSSPMRLGYDVGISSCGYVSTFDATLTLSEIGREVRLVPRIGVSALTVGGYGGIAGATAGMRLIAGRRDRHGVALDASGIAYPGLDYPLFRVGLSYVWGGS